MKLSELLKQYNDEQAVLKSIQEAMDGDDFDVMKLSGVTGDTPMERIDSIIARKEANTALYATIEKARSLVGQDISGHPIEDKSKDASKDSNPATPVYAQPKSVLVGAEAKAELYKGLFDNQDFMDFAKQPVGRSYVKRISGAAELIKASILTADTIQAAPVVPQLIVPLQAMDVMYMMPWNAETYRRRVQSRAGAAVQEPGADVMEGNSTIGSTTQADDDFNMKAVQVQQPVTNLALKGDPSVINSTMEICFGDIRAALQTLVVSSADSHPGIQGFNMQIPAGRQTAVPAEAKILATIEPRIAAIQEAGGLANFILANAANAQVIRTSLRNQRSPFMGDQDSPYGSPMGARVVLTPGMPANTLYICSFDGSPRYHVIPVMGDIEVEVDTSMNRAQDESVVHAKVYAQSVVNLLGGFWEFTATNNFEADES